MFGGLLRGVYALPPTAQAGGLPRCIRCDGAVRRPTARRARYREFDGCLSLSWVYVSGVRRSGVNTRTLRDGIPLWAVGAVVTVLLASFAYGIAVRQTLLIGFWMVGFSISLFVVYLLYRFVVAFEKIAEKY